MYSDTETFSKSNILLHGLCLLPININLCKQNQRYHVENGQNLPLNLLLFA